MENLSHPVGRGAGKQARTIHRSPMKGFRRRTINSDSNELGKGESVVADERRDLSEWVGFEVLGGRVAGIGLNEFHVKAIGLRNHEEGGGAGIALRTRNKHKQLGAH